MSTISDVARAAGVSAATVSRALRGVSSVSASTRGRVLRAAEELEYVASPTAASLASGRTRVVGIVTPFMTRWFFASAVSAIEKTLREHDYLALLVDLEADSAFDRLPLTPQMLNKRFDGLVVLNVPLRDAELTLLDKLDLPTVAIGNPVPGRPLVRIDDEEAVRTAVDHLVDLGHTMIGYAGAVPADAEHRLVPWGRLTGFRNRMLEHGLVLNSDWILTCDWSAQDAAKQAMKLFLSDRMPSAVVAASDEIAIGVMAVAAQLGLRVPQDLSVIGVDDYALSDVLKLTTVRQDVVGQGEAAADILLHELLGGSTEEPAPPLPDGLADGVLTLPTQLVPRRTTSPLRQCTDVGPPLLGGPSQS
ncbi:MAG TPA: LacI family DNA-binding transcriptional regulator [Ornithinimicrobium sp.]|uniref:LacI family DNA-binding transcriptional regulator n=1 Tax=Ornithinimicrobium sp. TaxID=1977084 RepID=UPI002B45D751|nr:LacI family DNA-binding transcriptional regulator [Ornithinimicrobium sp.]HKJ12120.1 LacI family DNA-binding transcriptional regulator [Ornithinimicrobium sp.]